MSFLVSTMVYLDIKKIKHLTGGLIRFPNRIFTAVYAIHLNQITILLICHRTINSRRVQSSTSFRTSSMTSETLTTTLITFMTVSSSISTTERHLTCHHYCQSLEAPKTQWPQSMSARHQLTKRARTSKLLRKVLRTSNTTRGSSISILISQAVPVAIQPTAVWSRKKKI